jgi:DNA mismatch endonuclease, patch repair protein
MPKSKTEYWREKFEANIARDAIAIQDLEKLGWNVIVLWECETKDADLLRGRLSELVECP